MRLLLTLRLALLAALGLFPGPVHPDPAIKVNIVS